MKELKSFMLIATLSLSIVLIGVYATLGILTTISKANEEPHISVNHKTAPINIPQNHTSQPNTITLDSNTIEDLMREKRLAEARYEAQEEEHEWLTVMATAYTNAPGENGQWGAHDCKYGFDLIDGEHIAADLSFLPYGTRVYIEGLGERTVVDTASQASLDKVNKMAKERNCDGWCDVYMGSRNDDMDAWGITIVRLYIIEETK